MALGSAEELRVNVVGDASQLKGALDKAGGHVTGFSQKISGIGKTATIAGGIVTGIFATIVKKTADVGDKFDKMSERTGISVEKLSGLAYAADICGTDIDTVENSVRFLGKSMKDTSDGTGEAKDAFEELGISVIDADGNLRDTVDVMKEAATKLSEMDDKTRQAALAGEIFGSRYGTKLLPMLKKGGAGIEELMGQAEELNLTVSTESSKAAADFTDSMTRLKGSLAGAGREIGDVLIPALTPLIEKITEIVGRVVAWAKENPELVATIVKVGAVIGAIAAVGGPILMAVAAFGAIVPALAAIGTIATGPVGLVIAAVVGLALAWKTNFLGIRDITKSIIDAIKAIFNKFIDFFGNIKKKITDIIGVIGGKIKGLLEKIGLVSKETVIPIKVETPAIPFHQEGIKYVPKKGIYGLDVGERVLTAKENISYDQRKSFSPTINIYNPVVRSDDDISKIRQEIKKALDEMTRQYGRSGYELVY